MPKIPAQVTRVELAIIVAALVVLVLSNRPPESGNAGIRLDVEGMTADAQEQTPQIASENPLPTIPMSGAVTSPLGRVTTDNLPAEPIPQPPPKRRRIGMVDARKCDSLRYPEIIYGEITVRPVWNGTKFEWQKVCEVKEKNGGTSVWSFEDPLEGVIVAEVPQQP